MSVPCNIKENIEAYNKGVESFMNALLIDGNVDNDGNLSKKSVEKALRFAVSETQKSMPEFEFDPKSLIDPLIDHLKQQSLVSKDFSYTQKNSKKRKEDSDKIKELAESIFSKNEKTKGVKKEDLEVFKFQTQEERDVRDYISRKYGKLLDRKSFDELMNEESNGVSVKQILTERVQEENDIKDAAKKQKEANKKAGIKEAKKEPVYSSIEKEKQRIEKEKNKHKEKIEKLIDRIKGLSEEEKTSFAKKLYSQYYDNGFISDTEFKNIYAAVKGITSTSEKLDSLVEKQSKNAKAIQSVTDEIKDLQGKMEELAKANESGKLDNAQNELYSSKINELKKQLAIAEKEIAKSTLKLAQELQHERYALYNFNDRLNLNLMGAQSLIRNLTGAVPDATIRVASNTTATVLDNLLYAGLGSNGYVRGTTLFGKAKIDGLNTFGVKDALSEASSQFKYGNTKYNGTLNASVGSTVKNWNDLFRDKSKNKILSGLSLVVNAHPDFIQRTLGATDALVHSVVYASELNALAELKGLSGAQKDAFLINPDSKIKEMALLKADKATYRNNPKIFGLDIAPKLKVSPEKLAQIMISIKCPPKMAKITAGLIQTASILTFPFVKVPLNILIRATKIALPELDFTKYIFHAYNESDPALRKRLIGEAVGGLAVGFLLRKVAMDAIALGLISLGYKDEERKAKDAVVGSLGGQSTVNLSAIMRGLTGGDMKPKDSDVPVSLSSLGATGVALGAYVHAFGKMSKEEREENMDYFRGLNTLWIPARVAVSEIKSVMDNTFLAGTNQLFQVLQDKGDEKWKPYFSNQLNTLLLGVTASTYQKTAMAFEEDAKMTYDNEKDFSENVWDQFTYRNFGKFGGSAELRGKYFSLAVEKNGETQVTVKKDYFLFDNSFGRAIDANFDALKSNLDYDPNSPISRLYKASIDAPMTGKEESDAKRADFYPEGVDKKQSIKINKESFKIELTKEQWEYLQVQTSNYRMIFASSYIMDENFENKSIEQKIKDLKSLYKDGLIKAKEDLVNNFSFEENQYLDKKDEEEVSEEAKMILRQGTETKDFKN